MLSLCRTTSWYNVQRNQFSLHNNCFYLWSVNCKTKTIPNGYCFISFHLHVAILQMEKPRITESNWYTQSPTASKRENWDSNGGPLGSEKWEAGALWSEEQLRCVFLTGASLCLSSTTWPEAWPLSHPFLTIWKKSVFSPVAVQFWLFMSELEKNPFFNILCMIQAYPEGHKWWVWVVV